MTGPTATSKLSSLKYMPQLDAIRAFAVFLVLIHHFPGPFPTSIKYGAVGVQLFFVISGFLITRILLVSRDAAEAAPRGEIHPFRVFYVRRFLRIFPVFYFVLFLTAALDIYPVRETFFWHFSYLSNFYFAGRGDWHGPVSHYWTLAVEEQFYLVWPLVILCMPRKHLLKAIFVFIAAAPVFRFFAAAAGMNEIGLIVMPFSNLDSLGMGALFGYLSLYAANYKQIGSKTAWAGFLIGLPLYASDFLLRKIWGMHLPIQAAYSRLALALFMTGVVFHVSMGVKGWAGRILNMQWICYIGKISYGIYIYHNFVPHYTHMAYEHFGWTVSRNLDCLVNIVTTVIIASLSWHLMEAPINKLKNLADLLPAKNPKKL